MQICFFNSYRKERTEKIHVYTPANTVLCSTFFYPNGKQQTVCRRKHLLVLQPSLSKLTYRFYRVSTANVTITRYVENPITKLHFIKSNLILLCGLDCSDSAKTICSRREVSLYAVLQATTKVTF